MKSPIIEVNAVQCNKCKDVIFSRAIHDYRQCSCGNVAIDGGFDYLKIVGTGYIQVILELEVSKQDLYNDWNISEDKYGILKDIEDVSSYS